MADRHEAAAMTARSYENLVEREGLLDEICDAVDRSSHGAGSVLLLTGEAGIGKTSAVRAAVHRAGATTTVSWGRCAADRSAPPFWPWRDATGFAPATPHPAVHDGGDQAIGAERFDLLNRLRDQLVAQARHSPTLHVIEDLQWADVSSVLLLQHLATVVGNEPMVVVATLRTGEQLGSQLAGALDELGRLATVREVPPLSEAAVAKLVHGAGLSLDAETVADVCARTGGNPLFVTELLRTVRIGEDAERLHDVLAGSVPGRVSELISQRLAALPDPVAALVVTASVIGTEGDALLLAAVRDTGIDAVLDLLEQARAVHILDPAPSGRWRFRHDLVRDAVYASVPEPVRARQHAAALEALGAVGTTPAAILARHAVAALPLFDPERAVALAARAGESAFAGHAYEEAVDWFEVALATAPAQLETRWRAELLVLTGEAHRNLGAIERARQACVEAAELTDDPALLARAALGFADPGADLGIAYRTDDAVTTTLLERAIAANTATDSVTTVVLEARLAAELYFSDDPGRARSLATAAVDRAGRIGDAHALSAAHAVDHDAFVVGQAPLPDQLQGSERQLAWARESGSAAARLAAHRARVFDLLAAGDLIGVDAEVLAFRRIAEPLGVPGYLWWLGIWSAMRALLEGRHDDAEARALSAFELGARPFASLAAVNLSFLLFFLRREQGRLAELEQATRDHAASHADIPAIRVALALLLAETGGVDEASGLLTALVARGFDRLRDRNWPASWFQLARCAALAGDRDTAARLLEPSHVPTEHCVQVSLATVCLGATDLARAWLLHTCGDLDAAAQGYAAAAEINARVGARSWLVETRCGHARLLVDRDGPGDRMEARRLLGPAVSTAEAIGLRSIEPELARLRDRLDAEPATAPATPAGSRPRFVRTGSMWELDYSGTAVQVPHHRGLTDLAALLARPGQEVPVLELLGTDTRTPAPARGAPALDERARRELRDRLADLDADVSEAEANNDIARATAVREERQRLAEAVARDLGLGGRPRLVGDPVERARKTVSTRIRRAIRVVDGVHPELGRHLDRSVDTGAWCAYRPAEPVTWIT